LSFDFGSSWMTLPSLLRVASNSSAHQRVVAVILKHRTAEGVGARLDDVDPPPVPVPNSAR
jgi:hypothetical protein